MSIVRDCASANIMMDAQLLFPQGHHPVRLGYVEDGLHEAPCLSRQERPVKYYFIDFGLSSRFEENQTPLVLGTKGRDKEPPELDDETPYNPFLLDIFILGNVYLKEFAEVSSNFTLTPLCFYWISHLLEILRTRISRAPNRRHASNWTRRSTNSRDCFSHFSENTIQFDRTNITMAITLTKGDSTRTCRVWYGSGRPWRYISNQAYDSVASK